MRTEQGGKYTRSVRTKNCDGSRDRGKEVGTQTLKEFVHASQTSLTQSVP